MKQEAEQDQQAANHTNPEHSLSDREGIVTHANPKVRDDNRNSKKASETEKGDQPIVAP